MQSNKFEMVLLSKLTILMELTPMIYKHIHGSKTAGMQSYKEEHFVGAMRQFLHAESIQLPVVPSDL